MSRGAPLNSVLALGWTLLAAFGLWVLMSASVAIRPSAATDVVQLGAIEALVFVGGVLWVLQIHGSDRPLSASLGLRPTHPALPVLGVLLGLALHFPAEAVDAAVRHFVPSSAADLAAEAALLSAPTPWRLVVVLVVIACVGPFVEELFFRGALFGSLRKSHSLGVTTAVISACFVIGHLSPARWPALAIVAGGLTYVRAISGSLVPSIALHVAFNAVTVLAFATGMSGAENQGMGVIPIVVGTISAGLLLMAVHYVASRAKLSRRGRAEDTE